MLYLQHRAVNLIQFLLLKLRQVAMRRELVFARCTDEVLLPAIYRRGARLSSSRSCSERGAFPTLARAYGSLRKTVINSTFARSCVPDQVEVTVLELQPMLFPHNANAEQLSAACH